MTLADLTAALAELGEPAYRARQVYGWMHRRGATDPHAMTELPAGLRENLAAMYITRPLKLTAKQVSADKSIKYAWQTQRGHPVEAVLMPGFEYGSALCLSTQSGCSLGCRFCATGRMGGHGNLSAGEILAQLYFAEADAGIAAERVVLMGMGEPLLNLGAVRQVVDVLTGKNGRGWAPKRITVSTIGLVKPLFELARTFPRVNLALSLHFTTHDARVAHMPKAEPDVRRLVEALYYFRQANGGKITLEYMLLAGLNDSEEDARRLTRIARLSGLDDSAEAVIEARTLPEPTQQQALPLLVNLIEYNPIGVKEYKPSDEERINAFARLLRDAGVVVTVRHSRGRDIAAACGMLGQSAGT
jgi:23S rRNA (adenine2503-C2)-methyltransferase